MIPGIDGTLALAAGGGLGTLRRLAADAARLREGGFDAALVLPNSFHAAWLARRGGIPERWGYRADLRSALLTRAVPKPRDARLHQAEYYQRLTRALDVPAGPLRAIVRVLPDAAGSADRLLRDHGWSGERLVGLAPGAAYGRAKRWPPERMGELAAALVREAGLVAVIVGTAADARTSAVVGRAADRAGAPAGRVIDLSGRTSLPQLAGVLTHCSAFVSNDSGAMHLAAALDVPVVAIFGPTREWATAPLPGAGAAPIAVVHTDVWCRPCMLRNCPIDHRCMTRIEVAGVRERLTAILRQHRPGTGAA